MSSKYRFQIDERYGDGPWVTQLERQMTDTETERLVFLIISIGRALDEDRLSLETVDQFCAALLEIDLGKYLKLTVEGRIAMIMAMDAGEPKRPELKIVRSE